MSKNQASCGKTLFICVPARLGSTRLPQKMLRKIGEQTMISHVCDRVLEILALLKADALFRGFRIEAVVLSDASEILAQAEAKGLAVMLSGRSHENGTSRIREYIEQQAGSGQEALVLNVQGDEPFLDANDVFQLVKGFSQTDPSCYALGTLAFRNSEFSQFLNPSCVKVVLGNANQALYFSRAPIPWPRAIMGTQSLIDRALQLPAQLPSDWFFWHHLGIYVYRAEYLMAYNREGFLDGTEGLEQLAALACGQNIWVKEALHKGIGIDTEEDLVLARAWHASRQTELGERGKKCIQ